MYSQPRSKYFHRPGFTLIELLIVIAIIALLISILMPSLAMARRQGRQLQCLTNLGSIGKAALFYSQEFKGYVIGAAYEDGSAPRRGNPVGYMRNDQYAHTHFAISLLNGLLYDHPIKGVYVNRNDRDEEALIKVCGEIPQLQCPSFPERRQKLDYIVNAFVQNYPRVSCQSDLERNQMRFRNSEDRVHGDGSNHVAYFHHMDTLNVPPSQRIYVIETSRLMPYNTLLLHDLFYGRHLPFAGNPRINNDKRHPKGCNALFFDGHSERMDFPRLDPGYPNKHGVRLRWFTNVEPPEYR